MEKGNIKMILIFLIGLSLGLFTTWEYEISVGVFMATFTYIIDVDNEIKENIPPMIFIYSIGVICGSLITLKFPELFHTYQLQLLIS